MAILFCSIQENLRSQNLQVHRQPILVVMMMMIENQEDQNQGLGERRKRKGTGQDPSIRAGMERLTVLYLFQGFLGTQKTMFDAKILYMLSGM